ncbi:response regulator [Maribacter sp. 2210JD10-5]|uniref:hybrid sensor histidine kinase/response regulator n=1 Tax=Maribacter sp. 2210JD10-5 TaxID=3386272 RepID=UPI0039BCB54E
MKTKRLVVLSFFLLKVLFLLAQDTTTWQKDTLQSILKKSEVAYEDYNYKDAIIYASQLIEKGIAYDDDYHQFLGYDLFGSIYFETNDSVSGRIYAEKALEIARHTKSDSLIARANVDLAIIYSQNKNTTSKGIHLLKESIALYKELNDLDQLYFSYINLAWIFLDLDKPDEAFSFLQKIKSISSRIELEQKDVLYWKLLFGKYYQVMKDYDNAVEQFHLVAQQADKDSIASLAFEAYDGLAQVYAKAGDYKNAFISLEKFNHYDVKIYSTKKLKETEKARAKFELAQAQKDLEIALREKEYSEQLISKSKATTTAFIVAIIILLIALLAFFMLYRTRKNYVIRLQDTNKKLLHAKDKAEKLSKVKTQFLSTVSHELRTPLYGVIGITSILKDDKKLKDYGQDLESLKFSADYLLALINDVLLLNKMDADAITLSKTPYQLNTLINGIVRSFEYRLKQNKNKLHIHIDKNVPNALIGDPVRFSQILMNLVGNAVKFNENGNIWLNVDLVEVKKDKFFKTKFTIKDDGIGIPENKQKTIFKEFSQVENENYGYKGTGLGLPIVKKLLKLYESDINLKSELGKGSEFSFSIDLIQNIVDSKNSETIDISNQSIEKEVLCLNKSIHILVAEDNKINQTITQRILEKYNFTSDLANDGEEAIALAKKNKYDLILMDVNMPNVDGLEATKIIREFNTTIPIIALTAVELEEMREKIMASGINQIINKPYDIDQFLRAILNNLSNIGTSLAKVI